MNNNYIVGGGIAGLITAYYTGYKIIDKNPMGQLNLRFLPGVRLLKDDKYAKKFVEKLNKDVKIYDVLQTKEINIGYEDEVGNYVSMSEEFKRKYSQITRGRKEYESSFLSSGESSFNVITADQADPNFFYINLFTALYQLLIVRDQIIFDKVKMINVNMKTIDCEKTSTIQYDNLISTIRTDILETLISNWNGVYSNDYTILKKHFYKAKYLAADEEYMNKYAYTYSISNIYTRKTFAPGYIVYETVKPLKEIQLKDEYILGHKIIDKYENVPLQLKKSLNLKSFNGIQLVGRFAEWNHSIKSNELIKFNIKNFSND